jgi:hypothetical protein
VINSGLLRKDLPQILGAPNMLNNRKLAVFAEVLYGKR